MKTLSLIIFLFFGFNLNSFSQTHDVPEDVKLEMYNESITNFSTAPSYTVLIAKNKNTGNIKEVCLLYAYSLISYKEYGQTNRNLEYAGYHPNQFVLQNELLNFTDYVDKYNYSIVKEIDSLIDKNTLNKFRKLQNIELRHNRKMRRYIRSFEKAATKFYKMKFKEKQNRDERDLLENIALSTYWNYFGMMEDTVTDKKLIDINESWLHFVNENTKEPKENKWIKKFRDFEDKYGTYFAHYLFNKGILTCRGCVSGQIEIQEVY